MTVCSYVLYVLVVYYHCPTDTNTEIKEVIFNFSICKLRVCKMRYGVNWQEVFKNKKNVYIYKIKKKWFKTRPGCICDKTV